MQENEDNAIQYDSSLLKTHRNSEDMEQYWFPTRENPGDEATHTPIEKKIFSEQRTLQKLEKRKPLQNEQSRQQILNNFDWKDSMLNKQEIAKIENLLVEFHRIFARHRFYIGMIEKFIVRLTPKDASPANTHSLPTPVSQRRSPGRASPFTQIWHEYNSLVLKIR